MKQELKSIQIQRFSISVLLLIYAGMLYGQEFIVNDFRYQATDISAREKEVLDRNENPCAVIKVRIGLSDVVFDSNSGIERVEKHFGEYWIWVSQEIESLTLKAEGFNTLEYKIPERIEENVVYVITISVTFPPKIVYRDTMPSYVSFASNPQGGHLFINDKYFGRTPMKVNIPYKTFSYKIKRNYYDPVVGSDTINYPIQGSSYDLIYDPHKRRPGITVFNWGGEANGGLGISTGRFGKTGGYVSCLIGTAYDNYSDHGKFTSLMINAGLTQQILHPLYISFGIGIAMNYEVFINSSVHEPQKENGFSLNPAIYIRIKKRILLNAGYFAVKYYNEHSQILNVDNLINLGIGYCFPASSERPRKNKIEKHKLKSNDLHADNR